MLWKTHCLVNNTYRAAIAHPPGPDTTAVRLSTETLYIDYLVTTQSFYKGFLQRICARHNVAALNRIAQRADLGELPVPAFRPLGFCESDEANNAVHESHRMLICLGDLARWRTMFDPKNHLWDAALKNYNLANELLPSSGYGHHQQALIYMKEDDHLGIVYNLYRALACENPHPNAARSLYHEFRQICKRSPPQAKGNDEAMVAWFVRLHANYLLGKEFAGHSELQKEVLSRFSSAMKAAEGHTVPPRLLNMVLINICAYEVALAKAKGETCSCPFDAC